MASPGPGFRRTESPASDIFSTVVFKSEEQTPYGSVVLKTGDTYDTVVHKVAAEVSEGERGSGTLKKRGLSPRTSVEPTMWDGHHKPPSMGAMKYEPPKERARQRSMKSPVHEKVLHEDPSLKYDLLNELGKIINPGNVVELQRQLVVAMGDAA